MVREVLAKWVTIANREMLARLSPEQRSFRRAVAWIVVILTVVAFVYVFYRVFRIFTPAAQAGAGAWQIRRYNKACLLVLPAISMILLWQYYPLARETVMAFQDYNLRGFSEWVGMDNFARVLFDRKFWFSVWLACKYAALFMTFAFVTPIALAFLLQEIPRGKILYRVIYYLPAVLSGTIVLFLWKSFYAPTGPINELIGLTVDGFNRVFGAEINYRPIDWLRHEKFAMPFSMLPMVWAGIGPGCLIYLAALKIVPDELYEAADIDGASIRHKVMQVAVPHIRVLIVINFIFAFVGAIQGSAGFMLAMTGGGPYGQTEVVGLHIFYTAFARLKFGLATAQAWIIGTFLIGFTVYQLKRLSQVEFRTAEPDT